MSRELRGTRYLRPNNQSIARFIQGYLKYLDFDDTKRWYKQYVPELDANGRALLGCNDRYFLLTGLCGRVDALHPWLFDRCREVERDPDGYIDLWARFHYKSSIITFAGAIQEIVCDPNIKIVIFSAIKPIAQEFLSQLKEEFESNETLKEVYSDVFYADPKKKNGPDGRPPKWGIARGITVKRQSNPKEATIEAHGLLDGQPTSRHFDLHIYDDVVTQDYITEDQIKKTTERWEMADNLGSHLGVRKWMPCTRYHFADTGGVIMERKSLKPRIYPATDDGTLTGKPVFLTPARWAQLKNDQRSTVSAQLLLNPIAGTEATFRAPWMRTYDVIPAVLNVYIMADPSKGTGQRSDRTAIAVVGIDLAGNKYLLDGVRHRMKLSERWSHIKALRRKWMAHPGVQLDLEVIEEWQERDDVFFPLEELNTPRQGKHSKNDRIERLEPDLKGGIFYLPILAHHADYGGTCYWKVWSATDKARWEADPKNAGKACPNNVDQIVYWPMRGLTRAQLYMEATAQKYRVITPIKRRDENADVYDLTRNFLEEALRHPFAPHDDLLDAVSRIYDMEPTRPTPFEGQSTEPIGVEHSPDTHHYDA